MILLGILVSFIMFSIIVLLHEYGHYKTARIFGIHIEEFGLGIPPRAKKLWKNKSGTLFSLNWIPLGGFVKIAGESEIFLSYFGKKGKILSLKGLQKKLISGDDIFDKKGEKIKKQERKFIQARLDSQKTGANFYEKNIFSKSAVLLAGVAMNFILAAIIFSTLFFVGIKPVGINTVIESPAQSKLIPNYSQAVKKGIILENEGIVLSPIEGSIAQAAGIQEGDILLKANNIKINDSKQLQEIIQSSADNTINFYISRNTFCVPTDDTTDCLIIKYIDIEITPGENGLIGSYLSPNISENIDFIYSYGLFESIKNGIYETYAQIRLTLSGLGYLVGNIFSPETPEDRQEAIDSVAGPIGIVSVITSVLSQGIAVLLILGAIISVNLGVFNLLPIPALDGGRLILLWIRTLTDSIFGKSQLSGDIENFVHIMFFMLLIALSILIAYNDIMKMF